MHSVTTNQKNKTMKNEEHLQTFATIVLKKICGHNEHNIEEMLSFDTISSEQRELFEEIAELFHTKEDALFTYYHEDGFFNIGIKTKSPLVAERFDRDFEGYYFKYWAINNSGAIL